MKTLLRIDATKRGIRSIRLGSPSQSGGSGRARNPKAERWKRLARKELLAYLAGRSASFSVPCDLAALPPFARSVLRVTAKIPYGQVKSYRWIAARLGKPGATRAVGNALAKNPIPVLIPCHRVIRSDGSLGGFALGLDWKRKLLALEKIVLAGRDR